MEETNPEALAAKHKEKGNTFYKKASYHEAIQEYTTAIDLTPKNSSFYNNRGGDDLVSML